MHLINNIKNFILDQNYFVGFYNEYIYIYNFSDIPNFNSVEIIVNFVSFKLKITGTELVIKKITSNEILIKGLLEGIKLLK